MKLEVRWSRWSERDLLELIEFIAQENADAAFRVGSAIRKAASQLGVHSTGRPGRTPGMYEKSVAGLPYIIGYEILDQADAEIIMILRVIHTARDWPVGGWPKG